MRSDGLLQESGREKMFAVRLSAAMQIFCNAAGRMKGNFL